MQRGLWLGVCLAVPGGVAWWAIALWPEAPVSGEPARRGTQAHPATGLQGLSSSPGPDSASRPAGLSIQGTVLGPAGLVAGARVLATMAVEGETLSTLPCDTIRTYTLLECAFDQMSLRVAELVDERRGEALAQAETVSAEDGSFVLTGLEAGAYALWVEGAEGTGFQQGVAAGSTSVVLRMGPGVRLSGTVTDEMKAPVPGALVTAIFSAHSRFFETVTDAHGRYELGPLPGGALVLVIRKEGMLPTVQLKVAHKAEVKLDFELTRPRRLTGRVLRANVPVAGVVVRAAGNFSTELGTAATDAQGRYSFEALPAFDLHLTAQHEGMAAGVRIEAKDSREQDIDLELRSAAVLEGVVRDEYGQPIEKAELMLFLRDDTPEDGLMGPTWGRTAQEGHYRIGPLLPGRYGVKVSHPRFLPLEEEEELVLGAGETRRDFIFQRAFLAEGVLVDDDGEPVAGEYLSLTSVNPEGPSARTDKSTGEDGRFVLAVSEPGAYLLRGSGVRLHKLEVPVRVPAAGLRIVAGTLLTLEGDVVDDAGGPLPQIAVSLWNESDSAKSGRRAFTYTDEKGHFSLDVPAPGRYEVSAVMAWKEVLRVASQKVVVEGKRTPPVRLRMPTGKGLSGVVVDWHGRPVPEALLQLLPSPRYTERVQCCHPDHHLSTDAEGRFAFAEAWGEYVELCIEKGDYAVVGSTSAQPRCTRVKNDGQPVRVILGREGFVTGRLVRADGSPVTHFFVNGEEKRREDGELSIRVLQPGVEPINLSAPGGYSVQRIAPVFADGEVIVDLGSILLSP